MRKLLSIGIQQIQIFFYKLKGLVFKKQLHLNSEILKVAYHEAGHALMAHFVGWSIHFIKIEPVDATLYMGETNYDFNDELPLAFENLHRTLIRILGGPVSQMIYEDSDFLIPNQLENDGEKINELTLILFPEDENEGYTYFVTYIKRTLLEQSYFSAREEIVIHLATSFKMSKEEFMLIVEKYSLQTSTLAL